MIAVLLLVFVILLVVGMPIAFSMGLSAFAAILMNGTIPLAVVVQRIFSGIDSFPLMAVPFFILAGLLMDTGGISARLVKLASALVGHIRGSLAMVVVISEIFFSGISGSTTADISAIGSMLIPAMKRAKYTPASSAAIVAAASSMGVLIPPCIMMVVLGSIVSISIGALFLAGFLPAAVMAAGLLITIYFQARRGDLPADFTKFSMRRLLAAFADSLLALLMPVIIFGGIIFGVATPTEIAAVAVAYGFVIGFLVYRELKLSDMMRIFEETVLLTGAALFLVASASIFSWILASQQVPLHIGQFLLSLSSGPWLFIGLSILIYLIVGAVLEGMPAIIVLTPILLPIAAQLKISALHYAILSIGAVGVGIFLPPIGVGLLISCAIAGTSMGQVARPFLPYLVILLLSLLVIAYVPEITLIVPRLIMGGY